MNNWEKYLGFNEFWQNNIIVFVIYFLSIIATTLFIMISIGLKDYDFSNFYKNWPSESNDQWSYMWSNRLCKISFILFVTIIPLVAAPTSILYEKIFDEKREEYSESKKITLTKNMITALENVCWLLWCVSLIANSLTIVSGFGVIGTSIALNAMIFDKIISKTKDNFKDKIDKSRREEQIARIENIEEIMKRQGLFNDQIALQEQINQPIPALVFNQPMYYPNYNTNYNY